LPTISPQFENVIGISDQSPSTKRSKPRLASLLATNDRQQCTSYITFISQKVCSLMATVPYTKV